MPLFTKYLGRSFTSSFFKRKKKNAINFQNLCLTFGNGTINRLILHVKKKKIFFNISLFYK